MPTSTACAWPPPPLAGTATATGFSLPVAFQYPAPVARFARRPLTYLASLHVKK